MSNLIPCPVTENDKHRILGDLVADMNVFLKARSDLLFSGERAAYYAALNEYIKGALYTSSPKSMRRFTTLRPLTTDR